MKQRAKMLIEFPDDYNVAQLKSQLTIRKCKVEVFGVYLPLKGMSVPEEFLFEEEK